MIILFNNYDCSIKLYSDRLTTAVCAVSESPSCAGVGGDGGTVSESPSCAGVEGDG